jgi:hypothetical protein
MGLYFRQVILIAIFIIILISLSGCMTGTLTNEVWTRTIAREYSFTKIEGLVIENEDASQTLAIIGYTNDGTYFGDLSQVCLAIPIRNGRPIEPYFHGSIGSEDLWAAQKVPQDKVTAVLDSAKSRRGKFSSCVNGSSFIPVNTKQPGIFISSGIYRSSDRGIEILPYDTSPLTPSDTRKYPCLVVPESLGQTLSERIRGWCLAPIGMPIAACGDVIWIPTLCIMMMMAGAY